jgi:OOP family OmpA-OmpF porin
MSFRLPTTLLTTALLSFACAHAKPAREAKPAPEAAEPAPEAAKPAPVVAPPAAPHTKATLNNASIDLSEKIQFSPGKADILPESAPVLLEVRDILLNHPEIDLLQVEGYTSTDGAAAQNLRLSQERADAVIAWLAKHGVEAQRLKSMGFGADSPIADNSTEIGREKNRRVDFKILKKH